MKRIITFIISLLVVLSAMAQITIKSEWKNSITYYGLYNERTERWVLRPTYKGIDFLGTYEGTSYWAVQTWEDGMYGIISSKNFNKYLISPKFAQVRSGRQMFDKVPVIGVKQKTDWGLIEIGTPSCYWIETCKYKDCNIWYSDYVFMEFWDRPNYGMKYTLADLRNVYVKKQELYQKDLKEAEARKAREEEEKRIAAERAQKEKELASFTLYAKAYVTPKVNAWQQKGEFEKLAAYQERVTGPNREQKIREWTKEAEDKFIKENAELNPIAGMKLEMYDSESEVFSVQSPKFGQLLVPVPIDDGVSFKKNFSEYVSVENPVYFIDNDKIALRSVTFHNKANNKYYYYNNQLALNYKQYEIDADLLGIDAVRITSSTTTALPTTQIDKPTCEILFPPKGSTYSTPTIKLRYVANVDSRTTATVRFYVAGQEVKPIEPTQAKGTKSKGAVVVQGTEVELPMPQDIGRETAVSLQVVDGFGTWAEPKTITLKYMGEKPKPTLHLFAVGVSDYPASDLQNLNYAAKDAQDFVKTITSSDLSMYKEVKPTLIVNDEATTKNLQRQLFQLTSRVAQGDVVMLFFSGHGIVQKDERFFMTADASAEDYYNGLEFGFIRKRMTEMSADKQCRVLVFMDACHSGAMIGAKGNVKDITLAAPGVIGFYSSTAGEQSAETDKLQNGVFTRVLLDGLKGGAKDKDGQVTIHQLDTYIKQNVTAKTNGKQTPLVENATGDAVLFHIKK